MVEKSARGRSLFFTALSTELCWFFVVPISLTSTQTILAFRRSIPEIICSVFPYTFSACLSIWLSQTVKIDFTIIEYACENERKGEISAKQTLAMSELYQFCRKVFGVGSHLYFYAKSIFWLHNLIFLVYFLCSLANIYLFICIMVDLWRFLIL